MGDHHTYLRIFNQFCAAGKSTGHDDEREQIRWCRDNFLNFRSLRSAVRIREQLWDEVKNLREMTANGSNSNGNRDNKITSKSTSSSSLSISSSGHAEDIRLMNAILTGLYPHAARLCAGNDVVYRSLPFSSLKGEEPVDVMLLHTNASSALSLGAHRPPEYVVYQDLVFGGRATIRHVCAVEYSALQKIRSMFSAVHLDQLRGLPMPEPKPKITTTTADTKINDNKRKLELSMTSDSTTRAAERSSYSCTSQTIISENQSSVSVVAGQSVNTIDRTQAARERFLARQRTS